MVVLQGGSGELLRRDLRQFSGEVLVEQLFFILFLFEPFFASIKQKQDYFCFNEANVDIDERTGHMSARGPGG
jgi:hypothetical protein